MSTETTPSLASASGGKVGSSKKSESKANGTAGAPSAFSVRPSLSSGERRRVGSVGRRFAYAVSPHLRAKAEQAQQKGATADVAATKEEDEDPLMLQRDAKQWKSQDHYAVLGLSNLRFKATDEQIKQAHRKKVLKHHPDKRAAAGGADDDSFFKCIQKANEILLDPVKRRQYDSVDEGANVDPPTKKQLQKGNFFRLWGPVFESEARFSNKQPAPKLGDDKSSKEDVEHFYDFWYDFSSWRTFEYLDEDVPDDNENRDQKRHVERKNANSRRKKKTEDTTRLRKLVDDCLGGDVRIKKFKEQEKLNKNKKKFDREAAEKRAKEDAQKKKEEDERLAKEKEEAEKAERAEGKKAKEAAKNAAKKNKRTLRTSVKDYKGGVFDQVELIMAKLDNEEVAALAGKFNGDKSKDDVEALWKEMADLKLKS